MKKFLLGLLFFFSISLIKSTVNVEPVQAVDMLCQFCPEAPGCKGKSGTPISSGENFRCRLGPGANEFKICKSVDPDPKKDCSHYEKFRYDGKAIYHVEEAPWSSDKGPEMCAGTDTQAVLRRLDPSNPSQPMKWVDRNISDGATIASCGVIAGFNPITGARCQTQHSSKGNEAVCQKLRLGTPACVKFSNGVVVNNPSVLSVIEGPGTGEKFYYYNNGTSGGWVGFDFGTGKCNMASQPIDTRTDTSVCVNACGGTTGSPPPISQPVEDPTLSCTSKTAEGGLFRPFPCHNCHLSLPGGELASGRISTFTVFKNVSIPLSAIRRVPACPELYATVTWGGTLQLDTDETTVPFAGYHSAEVVPDALTKYLADYYDGTSIYDGKPLDVNDPDDVNRAFMDGGVFRKLAPQVVQDDLRRKMIYRVRDRTDPVPPNNYEVKREGVEPAHISDFYSQEERIKPLRKDFPNSNLGETEYQIALAEWYKLDDGRWSRLWPAIPMVTREDSPGQMALNIQGPPGDLRVVETRGNIAKVSFPHLGRLKEIIGLVSDLFNPGSGNFLGGVLKPIGNFFNSKPSGQVAGEAISNPRLIAEAGDPYDISVCPARGDLQPEISNDGQGNYSACWNLVGIHKDGPDVGCWGADFGYNISLNVNGQTFFQHSPRNGGKCINIQGATCKDANVSPFRFQLSGGQASGANISMAINFTSGHFDSTGPNADCKIPFGQTVTCTLDASGKPTGNCVPGGPITPPIACGNQFFFSPGNVDNDKALEDTNSQLDVICTNPNPVTANITVVNDQVPISEDEYQEAIRLKENSIPKTVSREIGTAVLIPYLNQIWDRALSLGQTRISMSLGNLNNADKEARSRVGFNFSPDSGSGGVRPAEGWLYYPHLGGVQCGKLLEIASASPNDVSSDIQQQIDENCAEYKTAP